MKIVINKCYGGFGLSEKASARLSELKGKEASYYDMPRNDEHLVQVVEELGKEADGRFAELKIIEVPDDVNWEIAEYDGVEWVAEKHRTWS